MAGLVSHKIRLDLSSFRNIDCLNELQLLTAKVEFFLEMIKSGHFYNTCLCTLAVNSALHSFLSTGCVFFFFCRMYILHCSNKKKCKHNCWFGFIIFLTQTIFWLPLGWEHAIFTSFYPLAFSTRLHSSTSCGTQHKQHKIQGIRTVKYFLSSPQFRVCCSVLQFFSVVVGWKKDIWSISQAEKLRSLQPIWYYPPMTGWPTFSWSW